MPYKNAEQRRKYAREWVARRKAEWFADKICVKCGTDEDLQLDHIDPTQKVSHSIWSWSQTRREEELLKCQVLCRDCHEEKSIEQQPVTHGWVPYTHGTRNMYRRGCRCDPCSGWRSAYDKARRPHWSK